ncbi:MAG: Chemotaxis protein methyltransferase Cher2 [candidate division BRC1 bacterium ADurb.BinA364]|nr:MAG: Chemotaxis protein methyltransferase Cher2 [candidate division BRC1 bacterium ADurb.BinA364]
MGVTLKTGEFDLMRDFIETMCGILVGGDKAYLIESRLSALVAESGCDSFREFYFKAKHDNNPALRDRIVDLMTTNETLWFRDNHPFLVLRQVVLPALCQEIEQGKRSTVRIWSAASSSGQEPYSVAMCVLEATRGRARARPEQFEILATDISTTALRLAQLGRYDRIAISRGLPDDLRDRYFKDEGRVWTLCDEVKKRVQFKKFNLQDSFAALGSFDIVLCRNVAIYFSDSFKRSLFAKIARCLRPGGILLLGSSESISGYSAQFEMLEHNRSIYYRVRSQTA